MNPTRLDDSTTPPNEFATGDLIVGETCAQLQTRLGIAGSPLTYDARSGIKEFFQGNNPKPRLSIGVGVNWTSPFGPLRIDIAKALLKQEGDETKLFSFNVGTQF